MAIYDTMRFIKPDVAHDLLRDRDVDGLADPRRRPPGKRQALPNSRILIHQPHGGYQGQTTDIEIHAREAQFLRRRMEEIYAEHTGRPRRSPRATWSATASSRPPRRSTTA